MLYTADPQRIIYVYARFLYGGAHMNRYTYVSSVPVSTALLADFVPAFIAQIIGTVRQIQVPALVWYQVDAQTMDPGVAFYSLPIGLGGISQFQDGLPPEVVLRLRYTRPVAGVRIGYKRYSGIPEHYNSAGNLVNLPQANVNALLTVHFSPITVGNVDYVPVVVVTTFNGQLLPQPKYYVPTGAALSPRLGTQNTRKK